MSGILFSLVALAHADDSSLNVLNLNKKLTIDVVEEVQASLSAWHFLLRALGGDLKLEKSF